MYGLTSKISEKQQLFAFVFLGVALAGFVFFVSQSYFNTQGVPSTTQDDSAVTPPPIATVPTAIIPAPPSPTEKPTATVMISVTEASDENPDKNDQ